MVAHPVFRPPGEAFSLVLRVADGCPWNRCTFCGMYKNVRYRVRDVDEWQDELEAELRIDPDPKRVFLADGDVMALPFEELLQTLEFLSDRIPRLRRVSLYANGASILKRDESQLRALKDRKLHTLYMGLESGSNDVLQAVKKRETAEQMVEAVTRAQGCGLRMSIMILIGLGGRALQEAHINDTIAILNAMQPRLLSALRVIPVPGTELGDNEFDELSEHDAVAQIHAILSGLDLERTVFRANHVSNVIPLEGRFPRDKDRLLDELQALLNSGQLSRTTPGPKPLYL